MFSHNQRNTTPAKGATSLRCLPQISNSNKPGTRVRVKRNVGITHYTRYIKAQYLHFRILGSSVIAATNEKYPFSSTIRFAINNCGYLVGWTGLHTLGAGIDFREKYG